jgi:hypothetical protein
MLRIRDALLKLLGILLLFTWPGLLCGLLVFGWTVENTWQLNRFAQNFYDYPLPERTEVISRNAEVGVLWDGGDKHCDFMAEQILVSELSQAEIKRYYIAVGFPPVSSEPQFCETINCSRDIHSPVKAEVSIFEKQEYPGKTVFRIWIIDPYYPVGQDYRCY